MMYHRCLLFIIAFTFCLALSAPVQLEGLISTESTQVAPVYTDNRAFRSLLPAIKTASEKMLEKYTAWSATSSPSSSHVSLSKRKSVRRRHP
ncbi:hypothetical protein D9613_010056 [Agrocybe pediades]|uniref:Uncharacterized protein n=1 Tax=Agrocybe pediades TaxID=84607 RepID=A0A8H4VSM7_9AGAR|nr:hypothetical protein D9613_010056 [Agrocybe pediades]